MASLADQQAGRDFESYDDDRKEGRTDGFAMNARDYRGDWGQREGDARKQEAIDAALAQIERAFGRRPQALKDAA